MRTKPQWELVEPIEDSPKPHKRTGHTCVAYGEKLFLCAHFLNIPVSSTDLSRSARVRFGGTDFQFHYNDAWCFDIRSQTWKQLGCTGFVPSAREGHAAAIVDDAMYLFGGRGTDGKDLGDLYAFKIPSACTLSFSTAPDGY